MPLSDWMEAAKMGMSTFILLPNYYGCCAI